MKKQSKKNIKKTIKDIEFIDGRKQANSVEKVKNLEDLMRSPSSYKKFSTKSEQEFDEKIASMSLPELQSMAVSVGVFPSGNRTTLKNKLKKEFKKEFDSGKGRIFSSTSPIIDPNSLSEKQKKLFNL